MMKLTVSCFSALLFFTLIFEASVYAQPTPEEASVTPAAPAPRSTVELEWAPVSGASGYEVELVPKSGAGKTVVATPDAKITKQLPSGIYTVRIRSKDQKTGYFGVWSAPSSIEAQAHLIQPTAPADDEIISVPKELRTRVVFKWSPVADVKTYILKIWPDSQLGGGKEFRTVHNTLALNLPTGKLFHWQVRFESKTIVDYEAEPQTSSFTLLGRQLLTPILDDKHLTSPITSLFWASSPNAEDYHVILSRRYLDEDKWTVLLEIKKSKATKLIFPKLKAGAYKIELLAQAKHWIDSDLASHEFTVKPTEKELSQIMATASGLQPKKVQR